MFLKKKKIFGNYGNITGLEYLIRKKSVLYNKKKKVEHIIQKINL